MRAARLDGAVYRKAKKDDVAVIREGTEVEEVWGESDIRDSAPDQSVADEKKIHPGRAGKMLGGYE